MDNSFAITVAFIAVATLVAAFVRRVTKDKCLRDFRGNRVNLLHTDGKKMWGVLRIENTGLELIYQARQKDADGHGFIDTFHKNHPANLESLCKECHKKETKNDTRRRIKKTTQGFRIVNAPK